MRTLRRALGGGIVALAASLAVQAQAPVRPDLSGEWAFVRDPDGGPLQYGVLGDRFTMEQGPTALTMTRDFMERRAEPGRPAEPAHLVQRRFTYPFNEIDTPERPCGVAKSGLSDHRHNNGNRAGMLLNREAHEGHSAARR